MKCPKVHNKSCTHGFMLIELIVASLIASLLSAVLLTALSQSSRVQTSVDTTVDLSERIGIVVNQLEKDLAGAFVPVQAEQPDIEQAMQDTVSSSADSSGNKSAQGTGDKTDQKKQPKPIEKIFYGTNKDGMLDTLTLVTNNPLVVFVGKDVGTVKPKVVRVQYTLKPDVENKNSFILFRQESNELDLAEYKNVRPYEVIGGIKKLQVSYTARLEKKEKSKASDAAAEKSPEKPKKSYEYKIQSDWVSEKKDENKKAQAQGDDKEPEFPRIPYSVEFKITLWDKQNKKEKDYTLVCAIPVDSIEAQLHDEKESPPVVKKEEKKPAASPEKATQSGQSVAHNQVSSQEVLVYNGTQVLSNTLNSLKKLLGPV